jgi:hypothetical protein
LGSWPPIFASRGKDGARGNRPGSEAGILFASAYVFLVRLESIVLKELFVGSSPLQVNFFGGGGVDEHPIRFNMCVSVSGPIEFERMIFVLRRQRLRCEEKLDKRLQFVEVFAALLKPLHVAVKLA